MNLNMQITSYLKFKLLKFSLNKKLLFFGKQCCHVSSPHIFIPPALSYSFFLKCPFVLNFLFL